MQLTVLEKLEFFIVFDETPVQNNEDESECKVVLLYYSILLMNN